MPIKIVDYLVLNIIHIIGDFLQGDIIEAVFRGILLSI